MEVTQAMSESHASACTPRPLETSAWFQFEGDDVGTGHGNAVSPGGKAG